MFTFKVRNGPLKLFWGIPEICVTHRTLLYSRWAAEDTCVSVSITVLKAVQMLFLLNVTLGEERQ